MIGSITPAHHRYMPPDGGWACYMFGANPERSSGIVWHPNETEVPNWFWRTMQYLAFGNRWVKLR